MRRSVHRYRARLAGLAAALSPAVAATPSASAASAALTASVSVDAGRSTATIPATGAGSYADDYHWQTHTVEGGYVAPGTDFDTFMGTVRAAGAQPILTANYGSGTPEEAAARSPAWGPRCAH